MTEVKAQTLGVHIGAGLFHMITQHFAQRLLQQMRSTVIAGRRSTAGRIDLHLDRIAQTENTFSDIADVADLFALQLDRVFYHKLTAVQLQDTAGIALLAAHGGVERCRFGEDRALVAFSQLADDLVRGQRCDHGFAPQLGIAGEFTVQIGRQFLVHRHISAHVVGPLAGAAGRLLLDLHGLREAVIIHGEALFLQDLLGQIQREAVGIVQAERIGAVQHLAALGRQLFLQAA